MADWTPESRVEEILYDTINGEEYTGLPESRIEELLLELKEVIEAGGGGGGGTTNYNLLENKPQIGGVTLSGNKTLDDLGLSTELRKVMDMITGQFSTESDYSEGDIVIHDKKLYVFNTDHTAGQWNDLEVSQTTIEDLLSSISLSGLSDAAITSPTDGQVLTYNSTTSKWENADGGETKDTVGYRFVTKSTGGHDAAITVSKYLNGVLDSSTDYGYGSIADNPAIIDGYISFVYKTQQISWEYTILKDSLSGHSVGYSYSWSYSDTIDAEEEFYISEDTLAGLNDVAIVSPTAAQPLTYDSTNNMWVNGGIIPAANGGTGNTSGYIRAGIRNNTVVGNRATAEGNSNQSSADDSHAEGASNNATGNQSHAEGYNNTASGNYSHAEGANTTASGYYAHAEGMLSSATHNYAHAEGSSVASAQAAHSEGEGSTASGFCAHAGGNYGSASGSCSFSHGSYTNATAECSVAMGRRTNAGYVDQFIAGKYNSNKSTSIFEIGNGTGDGNRSNAIEVDTSGNTKIAGGIIAGGYIDDGYGHRLGFNKKEKINPFPEGASTITLYHENGITPISTSITDGVGMVDFNESQNGYEGFCIELNVTANTCYKVEFDYQNVDCQYWENQYTLGYQLTNAAVTDYANQGLWTNNIQRTTGVQHFTASITSTGSKVYLCFNVCAYSDSRTNHATLSNLTVYELQEGTEDLSNYVQKSLTAGLLKNDGTVDTNTYATTSSVHSIPSGGTVGKVLTKVSGTDYDATWMNPPAESTVYVYGTPSTDVTGNKINVQTTSQPSLNVNDLFVLKVLANYTYNGSSSKSWTFQQYRGDSEPTISWNVVIKWADGSYFNQDIVEGTCLTLVYTGTNPYESLNPQHYTILSLDVEKFDPATKADKVASATSGDIAGLDSNGNLTDSGIAASNVVVKSSTAGLLKNDGTVDTTTYASEAGTESLIDSTVGWTGKNLLKNSAEGTTKNGLTFIVNADKSVSVYGTASAKTTFKIADVTTSMIPQGNYLLSGSIGGASNTYKLMYTDNSSQSVSNLDGDTPMTIYTTGHPALYIEIANGANVGTVDNPTIFYPMIRLATVTDTTYEPYHKSVEECKADNTVIAPVENGATASKAYAVGEHFIRDGAFCTAKAAIASGGSFTLNTNYTAGKISDKSFVEISGVDLNNITTIGTYRMSGNITNNAGYNYGILEVYATSNGQIRQIAYPESGSDHFETRVRYNNNWLAWYRFNGTQIQ